MSKCYECKYEHSDCKGDKWVEKVACPYFSKKLAINYPKKIEELERKVEFFESLYQGQLDTNERLLLRADRLEAENKELKAEKEKFKEHIKSLDDIILKLKEENKDLRFESVRAFERGQKFPCNLNCDNCTEKCRAWQNGYNATCERECDNCEVIADMQNLKNVLSKLLFDYADDLRGDTE